MRTILRNGLDRYEVLKADEPLRRGERLVRFASQRGALDFLISVGGPARRDLHRLADDDFAGEFSTIPHDVLPIELATRITTGRLKIVHVETPPARLRSGGAEFEVLDARDRLRRGESPVRVMDEATAIRFARLLATLSKEQQRRLLVPVAAAVGGGSQREQTQSLSRLLRRGHIRIVRLQTLTRAGGSAPPQPEVSAFGVADAISLGVGFIPIVGDAVDIAGAIVGKDLITGETLTVDERIATAAGTLVGSGKAARMGLKAAKQSAKKVGVKSGGGVRRLTKPKGRGGKQARLRQILNDDRAPSHARGWVKQEMNSIKQGKRKNIRVPPGYELAHKRNKPAKKGFDYSHTDLQGKDLHRLQHKHEGY